MLVKRKVSFNVSLFGEPDILDSENYISDILRWYRKHLKIVKETWELKSVTISYSENTQKVTISYSVESDGSWLDIIDLEVCNENDSGKSEILINKKKYRILPENVNFT